MAPKNPWFLISAEEIAIIQGSLQELMQDIPDRDRERISGITQMLDTIKDRMA